MVNHSSTITLKEREGWLIAERKTSDNELEWQIVLAKTLPNVLPEVEVITNLPGIKIGYGPYFVRENLGFLRVFREIKHGHSWPWHAVYVPNHHEEGYAYSGSDPRIWGVEEDKWWWANSGPASHPDVGIRVEHADFQSPGYGAESGAVTRFFVGKAQVRDEGDLLIADRSLPDHVAYKQAELRFQQEMSGKPAPAVSAVTWFNDSEKSSLEELKGKIVLLDFWGQWCGPCVQKLPHSQELYEKYHDRGFVVIGIHSSFNGKNLDKFLKNKGITFPVALDDGRTQKAYFVESWPTYFLLNKSGQLIWGFSTQPPSDAHIETLLRQ